MCHFIGFELSFFSGVYSASIGFTLGFGDQAKQLVGMSGIFIGIGEVLGGVLFGLLGSKTTKFGRNPVVVMGLVIHLITFALIGLNLPNSAPFQDSSDTSLFNPPIAWLAVMCSFLLGFGDACFNTQIYSMLGGSFAHNSAAAFAIFKFTQVKMRLVYIILFLRIKLFVSIYAFFSSFRSILLISRLLRRLVLSTHHIWVCDHNWPFLLCLA